MPRATHQRFDDDDDYSASPRLPNQATPFGGLNAGKKTVEKRKRAAMEQERQFGGSEPRAKPRDQRERDNDTLPFGHRHFMTPSGSGSPADRARPRPQASKSGTGGQQIQFGKLSMPGGDEDTPRRNGAGASALVNRALRQSHLGNSPKSPTVNLNGRSSPLASTPSSSSSTKAGRSKRKSKQTDANLEEGEIEEIEFRKSGAGGGKVSDWGREMDEEERKAKRVAAAERKDAAPKGSGLSIKGRSKATPAAAPGQKYHGGY